MSKEREEQARVIARAIEAIREYDKAKNSKGDVAAALEKARAPLHELSAMLKVQYTTREMPKITSLQESLNELIKQAEDNGWTWSNSPDIIAAALPSSGSAAWVRDRLQQAAAVAASRRVDATTGPDSPPPPTEGAAPQPPAASVSVGGSEVPSGILETARQSAVDASEGLDAPRGLLDQGEYGGDMDLGPGLNYEVDAHARTPGGAASAARPSLAVGTLPAPEAPGSEAVGTQTHSTGYRSILPAAAAVMGAGATAAVGAVFAVPLAIRAGVDGAALLVPFMPQIGLTAGAAVAVGTATAMGGASAARHVCQRVAKRLSGLPDKVRRQVEHAKSSLQKSLPNNKRRAGERDREDEPSEKRSRSRSPSRDHDRGKSSPER